MRRPGRGPVLAALALLLLGGVAGGIAYDRHKTLYHFCEVDPGCLYRSGTLGGRGLREVCRLFGIRTIVNLRTLREYGEGDWYGVERAFASGHGIRLVDLPMNFETPPSPGQVKAFLEIARDPECRPVLVHCAQGVIRTGMMVAVYEIAVLGRENGQVFRSMPWFGHSLENRPQVREFILGFRPGENAR